VIGWQNVLVSFDGGESWEEGQRLDAKSLKAQNLGVNAQGRVVVSADPRLRAKLAGRRRAGRRGHHARTGCIAVSA